MRKFDAQSFLEELSEFSEYQYRTNEQKSMEFMKHYRENWTIDLLCALIDLVYRFGFDCGRSSNNDDSVRINGKHLSFLCQSISYHWDWSYGPVKIYFRMDYVLQHESYTVLSRDEHKMLSGASLAEIVDGHDKIIHKTFSGITQTTKIGLCQDQRKRHDPLYPKLDILKRSGELWLCKDCIESISEPHISNTQENKKLTERGKMSPGLRFDVLTRDNFTCVACGRSPVSGDDIKLHVDHITPIDKGGKTEMENLQALCDDCNRGKSNKVIEQMELLKGG